MGDVELRPQRRYIAQHLVQHNGKEFLTGAEFLDSDATEAEVAALRKAGALKLREEIESADRLAAERAQLEERNRELEAQLAELRAAQSGDAPKGKGAKAAAPAAESAPASAE
jgi:hypothetical protein